MNIDKQIVTLAVALKQKQGFYRLSNGTMVETVPEFYLANMDARLFPAYDKDLNAIHEAEEVLLDNQGAQGNYGFSLNGGMGGSTQDHFKLAHSKASKRLETLLKTLKRWTND